VGRIFVTISADQLKLCKQGHQAVYDHIGYKDEAEE